MVEIGGGRALVLAHAPLKKLRGENSTHKLCPRIDRASVVTAAAVHETKDVVLCFKQMIVFFFGMKNA